MDKLELIDQFVEIEMVEMAPIDMIDPSLFNCTWTNNIYSQIMNEYASYETEIGQQHPAIHLEEIYQYQPCKRENFNVEQIHDQNEYLGLDQLLEEFGRTTKEYDILGCTNDNPKMPLQHDIKMEQPSTNYEHLPIVAEQCQPSTERVLMVEKTTAKNRRARRNPVLNIDIVPIISDDNTFKFDCIETVLVDVDEPAKKRMKKSGKRTRIKYSQQQVDIMKKKFVEDPYPSNDYFKEIANMWNFKPESIKFWFQNERQAVGLAGAPTAKPLKRLRNDRARFQNERRAVGLAGAPKAKPLRRLRNKRADRAVGEQIDPQQYNFYECTNEFEPPAKKMLYDDKSNGSDQGFYSSG